MGGTKPPGPHATNPTMAAKAMATIKATVARRDKVEETGST